MRRLNIITLVSLLCSCENFNETMSKTSETLKGLGHVLTGKSHEERQRERRQAEEEIAKDKTKGVVVEDKGNYETITIGGSSHKKIEPPKVEPQDVGQSAQTIETKVKEKNAEDTSHETIEIKENKSNQEYERMEF